MSNKKTSVTMLDVAKEAGVALGTVSKVINGQPVGESYRVKVEQAVEKLGYQMNNYAKALKMNKTFTVAVIIPNTTNQFFAHLTHYLNISLERHNYKMLLCFTEYDRDREQDFIKMAVQNQVDGIIALTYNAHLQVPEGLPFVTIDRFFSESVPCVASDNFGGGQMAVRELAKRGCKSLAFLRIGSSLRNEPNKRKDGFVSECVERGIPFEICALGDGTPLEEFEVFLRKHFSNGKLAFDGLFCGTDFVAHKVVQSLERMGLRVPEDVQVVGFDGVRMFGTEDYFCSTIEQPVPQMAETCVNLVLSQDFSTLPPLLCLPVRFVEAGTTKPLAPAAGASSN
jgi:LacI family transcriptional regulator